MENNTDTDLMFDYIIIGTGPSGAIMAKTLSDNQNVSVLVLEAGENNTREEPIRILSSETLRWYPNYFWQGRTVQQQNVNRRLYNWTTGRTLGGGSSVNGGQYVRPTEDFFRAWERQSGPLWSPQNALRFYTQMEAYQGCVYGPFVHGCNGRVNIRVSPDNVPSLNKKFADAIAQATGYPIIQDYNDPETPLGPFTQWALYQNPEGERVSAATAYLSQDIITPEGTGVNGRRLTVLMKTTVLRILINEDNVAVGVEFLREGWQQNAFASRMVILSAGINTSQLLLLSGIGPADRLNRLGIPVRVDNPNVGLNLINHTISAATFTVNPQDLAELRDGPYSLYNGGAFLPLPYSESPSRRGIQMIGQINGDLLTVLMLNLSPVSRGSITLQNNDPLKITLADYNFLSDRQDLLHIINSFRSYILPIAEVLSDIDPEYRLISPSYEVINDDALLEDYIRSNLEIAYHEQGFNRMAPLPEEGVVNQWAEVYGVGRLLLADSSIIPIPLDCNTSSASYFIGYALANLLLQEEEQPASYFYPAYPIRYNSNSDIELI